MAIIFGFRHAGKGISLCVAEAPPRVGYIEQFVTVEKYGEKGKKCNGCCYIKYRSCCRFWVLLQLARLRSTPSEIADAGVDGCLTSWTKQTNLRRNSMIYWFTENTECLNLL